MFNATKPLLYTKGLFSALELILVPKQVNLIQCYALLLNELTQRFPHQIWTQLLVDMVSTNRAYTKTRQIETR
jgi:hypothetical protein